MIHHKSLLNLQSFFILSTHNCGYVTISDFDSKTHIMDLSMDLVLLLALCCK